MKSFRSVAAVALILSASAVLSAEPVPPTPAPAWKLRDVNGQTISSDQFKGKVVVVDFWATWCPPCRAELPGYISLQKKYRKDGLVIVGVSVDQDKNPAETVKKFIKEHGLNYQIVLADDDIQTAFGGMDAIPTTFIIDRDGKIRDRKVGAVSEADYEQVLLKYLK